MNERAIFMEALDREMLAERAAYLEEACGGDTALRQRVEALLTSHEQAGSFLDKPVPERLADGLAVPEGPTEIQDEPSAANGGERLDFLTPSDKPGSLGRLGHYEVLEVLGRGGFGVVVKAFDEMLHRVVAVKVMASQLAATSPARKRFLREARASASIRHDNVVAIYAVQEQPIPYLVMEYVAGQTLQQKLDQTGPLETAEVLRLGQQIASALAAAHARGLIHRDIKPANILLESGVEPRVKVTDFGLARAADDASLTQSGCIAGTPMYMAPEQAQGQAIDHRADLFSLGSVLYVMCSGRPPFRASTTLAVLKRVAEDTPRPIREIIPEVPEWLCALVAKLHAKQPAERFDSAKEVADLLRRCLTELQQTGGVKPTPLLPQPAPTPAAVASEPIRSVLHPLGETTAAGKTGKRRPWFVALAGGTAVSVVLAFVALLLVQALRLSRGEPMDPKAPVVFRVEANQVWQDTGVDVVEGEAIVLAPKGTWRKGQQMCSAEGLGQAPREDAACPEAPLLCLLVRIGDEPTPTPVGQREVFKPKRSGRLFVQANDLDLESNSEGIELRILGGLRHGDAAPPPGLLPVQAAERDWKPLLAQSEAPGVELEQVRDAVFNYCLKYAGTSQAFRAGLLLRKLPLRVNSLGMKLAPIPPGKFLMGSPDNEPGRNAHEGARHTVFLSRPYYLGIHAVTVGQFQAFVNETGYQTEAEKSGGAWRFAGGSWRSDPLANWRNPGFEQTENHPVVCVSWNDAHVFCNWLSGKEKRTYQLPTEAQWEYACRAGTTTAYPFGDDPKDLGDYAWYADNAENHTHPVGGKKPNPWGLYDMQGDVYQWCQDYYVPYPSKDVTDPNNTLKGPRDTRVFRGGCWDSTADICRSAYRRESTPSNRTYTVGLRVVLLP